ncbi:MAG: CRISPR-associated endonuclease Cas3'' [Thiobacillaceae bacterium]|nr:CRISPR-associated endonuclease Cas3'' [Thiobacillaceae bacterium]
MHEPCYAHSGNATGRWHPLSEHLVAVAHLAETFVQGEAWAAEARLAGLLHDLGKYGDAFQQRLKGTASGLDHWSAGAWLALKQRCAAAALAIQGHHVGLQHLDRTALGGLDPIHMAACHPLGLRLTAPSIDELVSRLQGDGLTLPQIDRTLLGASLESSIPRMLDVRRLFSALVDADFLDTEAHFQGDAGGKRYRQPGPSLNAQAALKAVLDFIRHTRAACTAAAHVQEVRQRLLDACLAAANQDTGLFTLTAPTGSGKTLAMLAFALRHAAIHGLQRIVVVIPYLTIIEQTASIYRSIFAADPQFGEHFLLEHHSLAGLGDERQRQDNEGEEGTLSHADRCDRLLAENWDAPLIVTTSVQFLESLFSNRPAACRKLHRLQRAVILFDEVQTLPATLAVPTLAALSHLASAWRSSVIFATATQPAFNHLDGAVRKAAAPGWRPREIVPDVPALFAPMKRVQIQWGSPDSPVAWESLAESMRQEPQVLCIVNLKRHAKELWEKLDDPDAYHLSTNLCPAHRQAVLEEVRARLKSERPVRLVATQCVEAGVDLDFPAVYRAWGPLDAILQAAGRCNREGRRPCPGRLWVFLPEDEAYPPGGYAQAAQVAKMLLRRHGEAMMRVDEADFITAYYRELYDLTGMEQSRKAQAILAAVCAGDFPEVARAYRLIEQDTINVLVPYAPLIDLYQDLCTAVERQGLTSEWIRRARPITLNLFRPKDEDPIWEGLLPVPLAGWRLRERNDWFIYTVAENYHPRLGLVAAPHVWIA